MSRLKIGGKIPKLTGDTLSGNEISLTDYNGSPFILSFYRYAGCPLCNLRIHDFIKKYNKEYLPAGVKAIAVFQSPIEKMEKYTTEHDAPFEIVSDPDYNWYRAFGVERSLSGFMKVGLKPVSILRSFTKGYGRVDPDGVMTRLPADFLISSKGVIEDAFYASDIGEHIPFWRIRGWIDKAS